MKTIRVLRQERGWTQFALALAVGVQPQAVYLWESGRRTPQVPQLRKLGAVFGLCSDEIALVGAGEAGSADRARHRPTPTSPARAPADPTRQDAGALPRIPSLRSPRNNERLARDRRPAKLSTLP